MASQSGVGGSILLVANFPPDVGYAWTFIENLWCELADVWRSAGRACYLAYPSPGPIPLNIREAGIVPLVADLSSRSIANLRHWTRTIRESKVKVVYLTDRKFRDPVYALFRTAGVRTIVNHDHSPGDRSPLRGVRGAFKAVSNRATPFTCDWWIDISPLMQVRSQEYRRIPRSRSVVVQNGIEPIDRGPLVRQRARASLGLAPDDVAVVTTGRVTPYKGLHHIVHVAAQVRKERTGANVRFFHIGDGPALSRFKELARRLGLDDRDFRFEGRRSDVRSLLPGGDIAIHAAKGEAFSLSILEYMSAGLATVVHDIPSVSQAIEHGRTGIVYRNGSVDAGAGAIRRLVDDPDARAALGNAAAEEVIRRFSWQGTRDQLRALAHKWLDS